MQWCLDILCILAYSLFAKNNRKGVLDVATVHCCIHDYWLDRGNCIVGKTKMTLGVGAGEGLAAMRGYQSGAEGAAVATPTLSREIKTVDRF